MHRIFAYLTALLCLISCAGPKPLRSPSHPANRGDLASDEIVIAATNDFHAQVDRAEGLASTIRGLRERFGDRLFYFDAGDLFQGSIEGNTSKGRAVVETLNAIGLDAAAIGNHDFDYGPDVQGRNTVHPGEDPRGNIKARVRQAHYPWLASNVIKTGKTACRPGHGKGRCQNAFFDSLGRETLFRPYAIFHRNSLKKTVCALGATTPMTPDISSPALVKGIVFESLERAVPREANALRRKHGCDIVVLLVHAGLECSDKGSCQEPHPLAEVYHLLNTLPKGTVDAVVAGHTHVKAQEVIHGTPVIESGAFGRYVGLLHILGPRTARESRFEPFSSVPESPTKPETVADVTTLLSPYRRTAAEAKARIVGAAAAPFPQNYTVEGPLSNLVADALLKAAQDAVGADFAFINPGGVKAGLPTGAILYGNLFKALPFDDDLAVVELKGSELRRCIEIATSSAHGVPGLSGLRARVIDVSRVPPEYLDNPSISRDLTGDGKRAPWERNLLLDLNDSAGNAIKDDQFYRLATLDFLVLGGDHQSAVLSRLPARRIRTFPGVTLRDAVINYLKNNPIVDPASFFDPARPRVELVRPM